MRRRHHPTEQPTQPYQTLLNRRADIVFALVRQIRANRDVLGLDVAGIVVEEVNKGEWVLGNSIIDPDAMSIWSDQLAARYELKTVNWDDCSFTAQVRARWD